MAAKGKKADNRWSDIDGGMAYVIPLTLIRHPNYTRLSPHAHKLLADLARQYSGFNNGYLCASWSLMKESGWKSSETLWFTVLELEHYRLLIRTQQGGKNKPNLHGFTWRRIDEKPAQNLEVRPGLKPLDLWKEERPDYVRPVAQARDSRRHRLKVAA